MNYKSLWQDYSKKQYVLKLKKYQLPSRGQHSNCWSNRKHQETKVCLMKFFFHTMLKTVTLQHLQLLGVAVQKDIFNMFLTGFKTLKKINIFKSLLWLTQDTKNSAACQFLKLHCTKQRLAPLSCASFSLCKSLVPAQPSNQCVHFFLLKCIKNE